MAVSATSIPAPTRSGTGTSGAASSAPSTPNAKYAAVADDNTAWMVQPYGVVVGDSFDSYEEAIRAQLAIVMADGVHGAGNTGAAAAQIAQDKAGGSDFIKDKFNYTYTSPTVSDASIGGNDAMNPYSAFGLDDDIVHNVFKVKGGDFGMGRCYSEIYDSKQQILYLTMGVPKYRNLTTWLKNATKAEMSELNENGNISSWGKLGNLLAGGLKLAIELPWLPIIWMYKIINSIKNYPVTEYFMFRDTMPLYYRYVNTLLSHIAVGMGIYGGGGNGANVGQQNQYDKGMPKPAILSDGPDIFKIMCKRSARLGKATSQDTDQLLQGMKPYKDDPDLKIGGYGGFWSGLETGALEGANFVGFRIERSDQASETFGNQTQESALLSKLNSAVQETRANNMNELSGSGIAATAIRAGRKLKGAAEFVKGLGDLFTGNGDLESSISYLAAGNGYFDLPKTWSNSTGMSRSLSFNMKLRARTGGDNVSIFQSIMVPLSMLLAAALPRAVGDTSYTSPFIIRAFCKGMFAIPAGIISSLSVTRGASEFGWSTNRLPTVVDVNFTIEDLSPMLFLSLAGASIFQQAFSNNTKMHEYLATLTGIGCKERYFRLGQLKRRMQGAWLATRNTTFSPTYWGMTTGDSTLVRSIIALTPYHRVKNN